MSGSVLIPGTGSPLPAGPVTSSGIADGSVASVDLADQAVTLAKIDRTGATAGKVLTGNGAGVSPSWETPAGGGGMPPGTFFTTPINFPLVGADLAVQDGDPWFDLGALFITPASYTIPGAASTVATFTPTGQVTRGGGLLFGDVRLYDVTHNAALVGMSFGDPFYNSGTGVVTMPAGPFIAIVQARLRVPSGALPGDLFNLRGVTLAITNTF